MSISIRFPIAALLAYPLVACCLLSQPGFAAEPSPLAPRVRQLVRLLDDDLEARRQAAEDALVKLGPEVLPLLDPLEAEASTEVKKRLAAVRKSLETSLGQASVKPSLVTLKGSMKLSAALAEIEKQTGNKLSDERAKRKESTADPTIAVEFDKTPFWQALDNLLDRAGLAIEADAGLPGALAIVERNPGELPRTARAIYSGIFRIEPIEIVAVRNLRVPHDRAARVRLQIAWEPRIQPIALSLPMAGVAGTDDQGRAIAPSNKTSILEAFLSGQSSIAVEVPLSLVAPPDEKPAARKFTSLRGKLETLLPGGVQTFEFDKLSAKENFQRKASTVVTLEQALRTGDKLEVLLRVRFDRPENALESHRTWIARNEARLITPDGKTLSPTEQESTRRTEDEAGFSYLFDVASEKDAVFRYRTPTMLLKTSLDFELKNIDLP